MYFSIATKKNYFGNLLKQLYAVPYLYRNLENHLMWCTRSLGNMRCSQYKASFTQNRITKDISIKHLSHLSRSRAPPPPPPPQYSNSNFRANNRVIFGQNRVIFGQAIDKYIRATDHSPPKRNWSRTPIMSTL